MAHISFGNAASHSRSHCFPCHPCSTTSTHNANLRGRPLTFLTWSIPHRPSALRTAMPVHWNTYMSHLENKVSHTQPDCHSHISPIFGPPFVQCKDSTLPTHHIAHGTGQLTLPSSENCKQFQKPLAIRAGQPIHSTLPQIISQKSLVLGHPCGRGR